ncbi:hypothetical protein OsI_15665 [Oryza sativa Indica Group]|uniref:Uncharacterized protein n=1 Tax=Oryza sativa subsp. indica TaxID=39946 RepID=B8AT79_ORYSI|nr:hypothetical protein OsI_15665 [Oryza sativa Indica Group]
MGRPPCCDKVGVKRGAMDAGGGPDAGLLHPGARRRQLARRADQHRADALQQELPAPVDELPPAGDQAGELHRAGGEAHRPPPGSPRQPVISPMKDGTFIDWDIVDNIWNHAFRQRLLINPEEHPMLIVEPSTNTGQQREKKTSRIRTS